MVRVAVVADELLNPGSIPPCAHELTFISDEQLQTGDAATPDIEALVVRRSNVTEPVLKRANRLKLVQQVGIGVDRIDLAAADRLGIAVANTPGAVTTAVVEHAFLLILAAARGVVSQVDNVRQGRWSTLDVWQSREIAGSTVGIVGFGSIGKGIARRALAFEARVLVNTRTVPPESLLGVEFVPLDRLLRESDIVVLALPLTGETRGLIGSRELGLMRPSTILVNVARGPVVDEDALIEVLHSGRLQAGLDVFSREPLSPVSPLRALPNVVATPHYGGASAASRRRLWQQVTDNLNRLEAALPPNNVVNLGQGT